MKIKSILTAAFLIASLAGMAHRVTGDTSAPPVKLSDTLVIPPRVNVVIVDGAIFHVGRSERYRKRRPGPVVGEPARIDTLRYRYFIQQNIY